jgi:hypothetical protein
LRASTSGTMGVYEEPLPRTWWGNRPVVGDIQRSAFGVRRSAFGVRRSAKSGGFHPPAPCVALPGLISITAFFPALKRRAGVASPPLAALAKYSLIRLGYPLPAEVGRAGGRTMQRRLEDRCCKEAEHAAEAWQYKVDSTQHSQIPTASSLSSCSPDWISHTGSYGQTTLRATIPTSFHCQTTA